MGFDVEPNIWKCVCVDFVFSQLQGHTLLLLTPENEVRSLFGVQKNLSLMKCIFPCWVEDVLKLIKIGMLTQRIKVAFLAWGSEPDWLFDLLTW